MLCCSCGLRKKCLLSERDIFCNCGNRMDRDLNSAVNIMKKYLYGCSMDALLKIY
ncbi:MAG: zinc ribbon domain-containing protein [Promethearchaeota archaeon]